LASPAERRDWLERIGEGLLRARDELARLITLENGKPLKEAAVEVEYAAGFFRYFATQLHRLEPEVLPQSVRGCRWTTHHRPAGVVGLITPWNFPVAMLAKKVSAALAAGCAFVARPSELTPLSAMALCRVLQEAGVAPGRANLVVGGAPEIAAALCEHPAVRLISFTGSTEVGRRLMAASALQVKRLALELGGNAPFIVFDDADVEGAAAALIANKFRGNGQTCVCTNRVYVQAAVREAFERMVVARVRALRVGNGLAADTDLGPLINRAAFDKVSAHVQDALRGGARRLLGGDPPRPANDWGAFYPPTVLTGITPDMRVCAEETFGPVVAIAGFNDEAEVIRAANGTCHGLAAYVFSRDPERLARVVSGLRFGHVGVNTGAGPTPEAPFGGFKQSGFGREGGVEGLLEFCDTQVTAEAP
jgi:succinate-semialdehyde dehydrogenase/glutarate-semialdehyde dehydrogenase